MTHILHFAETIRDTLAWHITRPSDYELKTGLKLEREKELLQAWHNIVE